jgi:hypothetical protein
LNNNILAALWFGWCGIGLVSKAKGKKQGTKEEECGKICPVRFAVGPFEPDNLRGKTLTVKSGLCWFDLCAEALFFFLKEH